MFKQLTAFTLAILVMGSIPTPNSFSQTDEIKVQSEKHLYQMSKEEINDFLKSISNKPFIERLEIVSEKTKTTPYFLGPLGEGSDNPYDKHPLIDLSRVDCVTFVEQTLAFAMSNNYDEAFNKLQKIRYKSGDIRIEKRNHYFMADWVANNSWFVHNVTKEVGGDLAIPLTRTISHEKFFANPVYKGIKSQEPDRTMTINYIPKDKLALVENNLHSGDIATFIINLDGIFVSHVGFIIKDKNGNTFFRNAKSFEQKQVLDVPYNELVEYLKNNKKNMGMAFIRTDIK